MPSDPVPRGDSARDGRRPAVDSGLPAGRLLRVSAGVENRAGTDYSPALRVPARSPRLAEGVPVLVFCRDAKEPSGEKWSLIAERLGSDLTPDERRLLGLLRDGKTQPEIAAALGLHRSAVWRRAQALR